jgi:hypothetical protein
MTASEPLFPAWMEPSSVVKAFPLVCVTVPWAWKKCVKQDLKARRKWNVNGARPFAPAYKRLKVHIWQKDSGRSDSLASRFNGKCGKQGRPT